MRLRIILLLAFAVALVTSGSVKALEEPKVMTPKSRETAEKMTPGHTYDAHKPGAKFMKPQADRTIRSKGKARAELSPTDQAQLDANIKDIAAVQNQKLLDPSSNSNAWPVSLREVVQVCDYFCRQPENTDGCGLVAGVADLEDLLIPAERNSFLTCFHQGTDKINAVDDTNGDTNLLYGGICKYQCTGNFAFHSCDDPERRTACKILCCSQDDLLTNCLARNGDTCEWYK